MSTLKVGTIQDHANSNTAITIDSSGRVNQPALPAVFWQGGNEGNIAIANGENFFATNDGQAAAYTDGTYLSYIQGGMTYTSTTGRFTVPIDGIYNISCTIYANEDGATFRIGGNINGTTRFLAHNALHNSSPSSRGTHTASATIKLNANDYITFTNGSGGTRTFYQGIGHTYGHIYLVG